jgi:hypothetical protein
VHEPPPQSMSDSRPFRKPSEQVAAMQTPAIEQELVTQSLPTRQVRPTKHRAAHEPPPQSTSVSAPSLSRLLHVATCVHTIAGHRPDAQSGPAAQDWPTEHFLRHMPPQSMSVSAPSLTRFMHVLGGTQRPPTHVLDAQSKAVPHVLPCAHFMEQLPPQSMSDSSPPRRPSLQVLITQAPAKQTFPG